MKNYHTSCDAVELNTYSSLDILTRFDWETKQQQTHESPRLLRERNIGEDLRGMKYQCGVGLTLVRFYKDHI